MNASLRFTLLSRDGAFCLGWVIVQQAVVACSTLFLILSAEEITRLEIDRAAVYALGFAGALIIVYLPNTISIYFLQRWRLTSYESFINHFVAANSGNTILADSTRKAELEPWLTSETAILYEKLTDLFYEIASTALSVALNVLVIAIFVDLNILTWYALSGVVLAGVTILASTRIKSASREAQTSRKRLSGTMLKAWDNVLGGNELNIASWKREFHNRVSEAKTSAVRYDVIRATVSGATVAAAVLLISFGNARYFTANSGNLTALTALLVTLPRQLQTIQNIFAFFNMVLVYQGISVQFQSLRSLIFPDLNLVAISRRISMAQIEFTINGKATYFVTPDHFVQSLAISQKCRVTLRAPNGAGKSSLIAYAAHQLYPDRVWIPQAIADLLLDGVELSQTSDGNRMMAVIESLANASSVQFVFLDEWDANLDESNIAAVEQVIQRWVGQGKTVIESRHRP